ncbi:carbohydrate ABC transporter permease [Scatolibacter rhodanostii]|uniref:carbohydrate ABC transporter permease n=1 Tax=Scatolibacter rhodanostii TaxID=2014781 RepID=UPI00278C768B|nr:carbohydrate ABC transporter permease [Scatolibacter rhodanostii]
MMTKQKTSAHYKRNQKAFTVTRFILSLLVAFIMIVPFVWMVSASFKLNTEIFEYPVKWIPEVFRPDNYDKVWNKINFPTYFLNTLKLAVIITVTQLFTCSLAAYSFTKLRFPGRDKLFLGYLATMMVPWHAIMIPQFIVVKTLNLYNTHTSLILIHAFSAFGVFLLRQNMLSIPDSLHEAAKIDGCGYFRTYWSIILPLTKTGLATLMVLTFNNIWNDYMGPMIYLDSDKLKTIQLGLALFKEEFSADYGAIMAGTVCSIIPIVIVYAAAQKYIVEGIAFAGVKG